MFINIIMGNIFSSECKTCQECPKCSTNDQNCPKCSTNDKPCPVNTNNIIDYIELGKDSNDSIIDLKNNSKQVLSPSDNKPYNGLLNMPVSYINPLYGPPVFYWEGTEPINITNNTCYNRIINKNASFDTSFYNNIWNARYMFAINNTTVTNNKPLKYIVLKLPINPNTHNSIFIQTITRDRWSNINMYICDASQNPVKKIFTNCNSSKDSIGNSSFLGPMNSVAQQGHHEWIQFSISIDSINTYKTSNNEIYVSINSGVNATNPNFCISGVAVVPNNYAVTTIHAMNLFWNCNSNVYSFNNNTWVLEGMTFNSNAWNEESLVHLLENKICKVNVPIISKNQNLILGIITHNSSWYDTSPMIYIGDTLYYLSQLISGRYGFSLQGRGINRYAKGIYIPKDVIKTLKKTDSEGIDYIEIIINQSKETCPLYIRGIYTEAVEEY